MTTDSRKYETAFGFNREEVERVLMEFGCMDQLEQVRYWYDGFRFGSRTDIYNPWSITKFLDTGRFENFWANTSSNQSGWKADTGRSPNIKVDMEDLLSGKILKLQWMRKLYQLSITNHEVKNMFRKMIRGWFQKSNVRYNDFIKALLVDDVDYMNEYMNQISLQTFSSFDTGKKVLIRKDVSNK